MAAVAAVVCFCGCGHKAQWQSAEGSVWHTTYRIVWDGPAALADSITAVTSGVEMSLSPFQPQSLISRINRGETDRADSLLAAVMHISKRVNAESAGRFDPTVAPLVNLWGFGTDTVARRRFERGEAVEVSAAAIDSALQRVGIAHCDVAQGRVVKKHPATTFNFSAVTKGLGVDCVADMLRRNGVANFMVEIGGEIVAQGVNPRGEAWRIQIDAPVAQTPGSDLPVHERLRVIPVSGVGVATSGNYRNFHSSQRYGRFGHTIDPVTGRPVQTNVVAATIVAPTAGEADAWATACMAQQADSALAMIARQAKRHPAVECLLVVADGDSLRVVTSSRFPK